MVIILMGVCGCGKTTIGEILAESVAGKFYDADDFHPEPNVAKMASGTPLTEDDRIPWLDALRTAIDTWRSQSHHTFLACSALTPMARQKLGIELQDVQLVYLKGSFELITQRMADRQNHYMPPELIQSQFDTLVEPKGALVVDIDQTPEAIAQEVKAKLHLRPA